MLQEFQNNRYMLIKKNIVCLTFVLYLFLGCSQEKEHHTRGILLRQNNMQN
jgi:hypothetical protein